jgi:hypothetical protein
MFSTLGLRPPWDWLNSWVSSLRWVWSNLSSRTLETRASRWWSWRVVSGLGWGREADRGFELIVVAVAARVVALAEQGTVLGVAQGGNMEAVRGGEVEALAEEDVLGGHENLQGVGGREFPDEARELDVRGVGVEVEREGVGHLREGRERRVGGWVVGCA